MNDALQRRGALGVLLLVVPIVSIVAVGLAYVVVYSFGASGRDAAGERVRIDMDACPEAREVVAARVTWMGLPDPVFTDRPDGFVLEVTLTGDAEVDAEVPGTLAAPGQLAIAIGDTVLATEADLTEATVDVAFLDLPKAALQLTPEAGVRLRDAMAEAPQGRVVITLDGEELARRAAMPPIDDGRVLVDRPEDAELVRLRAAARTAAVLGHGPLPCTVTVRSTTPVADQPGTPEPR